MSTPIERLTAWLRARKTRAVACGACGTVAPLSEMTDRDGSGGPYCSAECSTAGAINYAW